ncbi:MAG: 16S rRNA (adenine(1518)-N(6)/adenine(1519)-N(6))-dimethyltransferase RsmA [Algisphaera sp.]
MAQTLTDIKQLLATHGLHPKHKYGQNYLHDGNHMARIMAAANIGPGDRVLEVGPGTGALTERLLETGATVIAVEIDPDFEALLTDRIHGAFGRDARFELLITDVLAGKHHIAPAVIAAMGDQPFKLIANLPYQIASPLMANLVQDHPNMTDAVVMIQKEVADRLGAASGGKDYGPLGILIQALCNVTRVGTLAPGCFWPAPKIASAVVHLQRRSQPLTNNPAQLSALLHRLFTKRRKQIGSILGRDTVLPQGINPDARPEQLSVTQLIELAQSLDS